MAENKTQPTDADVEAFLSNIEEETRRRDCIALAAIMAKATKQKPKLWGTAIVGFGTHKYKYASGREGETCQVGFSPRKGDISIYGTASAPRQQELLAKLGKHKMGKGCLYISKLSDVNVRVLEELVSGAAKTNAG
jgi:Domain of unknown function (DU1801)